MHRGAGGLVEDQEVVVFIKDAVCQCGYLIQLGGHRRLFAFGHPHRRHAHHVAGRQFVFDLDASFIDPHLALTHDAINHALRHAFQASEQKVVDSLTGFVVGNRDELYCWIVRFHGAGF